MSRNLLRRNEQNDLFSDVYLYVEKDRRSPSICGAFSEKDDVVVVCRGIVGQKEAETPNATYPPERSPNRYPISPSSER